MGQPNSTNILEVADLTVHFLTDRGEVKALEGIRLSAGTGQVVGIIGESGSGKTTTGRAIMGILPPSAKVVSGKIHFMGNDLLTMKSGELNNRVRGRLITLIPQDPFNSLNPLFTIKTQIMDLIKYKCDGKASEDRIIAMLKKVKIPSPESALKKYPHQFSGGQRQRLMIAMALLTSPKLIIADEPTTALDVTVEAQIIKLLRELVADTQVSVLFITHDLALASHLCDRIMVLYAGQDMENAPAGELFTRPYHPYTNELLNSLPNPEGDIRDIPGDVPSLLVPPPGCRFHPRCTRATSECKQGKPPRTSPEPGRYVRCHHPLKRTN